MNVVLETKPPKDDYKRKILYAVIIIICFLFIPTMSADNEIKPVEKG